MLLDGIMLVVALLWVACMVVTLTENGGHSSTARDIGYALETEDKRGVAVTAVVVMIDVQVSRIVEDVNCGGLGVARTWDDCGW